ncbi:hypothetical protein WOLCODRAFT_115591 [Wolfiporia cocos MD-104 SS10]|uniref:Centrosomin N-terminal motif 1 domain-containing protein n=1 Tax=Wolfiporia cocos (strain MD-104) TaxID=742152 RepID=A0A2H3JIB1_WOLCO|nr:hypothetical protein WOLCODRAFT_115591 [Wolfiporia cocos MD-104 SS10]
MNTPALAKRTRSAASKGGVNLTLRDQEKHIDSLKKENFNIKLKVHFLEERLAQLAPDQIDAALKQNINLKIEVQQRGMEMKKLKKLVLELERELERLQRGSGGTHAQVRELEEKLGEREGEIRELRRRRAVNPGDDVVRDLEARNADLEEDLENVRGLLEENTDEIERLKDLLEKRGGDPRGEEWQRRAEEVEEENEDLHAKIDELEELRSNSAIQILGERREHAAAMDNMSALQDKLVALQIELQQKEGELDLKEQQMEEQLEQHKQAIEMLDEDWKADLKEAAEQNQDLRDALDQREAEAAQLRLNIAQFEAQNQELHEKFEETLERLRRDVNEKETEIYSANREIQQLSQRNFDLEEELERFKTESERIIRAEAGERERLAAEAASLQDRAEELLQHIENLAEEVERERAQREQLEAELTRTDQEHDAALRREQRALDAKEDALQNAQAELARAQSLLAQREADLAAVQHALEALEAESKKLGESHTTARFSLQLEVDRLTRDLARVEDELARARRDLGDREGRTRERDSVIDKLHVENRELAAQLAAQTQARLNISEKLDEATAGLKTAEAEAAAIRGRLAEVEQRLAKEQRSFVSAEAQYRDQISERNTLLLTIYQFMDKIIGVDKTPKKNGQAETKPYTNFPVFHDNLVTRLKSIVDIQEIFNKRAKEAEARYTASLGDMRKQLDARWRQIDKFEASVRAVADQKATWRKKLSAKEGEVEALKATILELQSQLVGIRRASSGADATEVRALTTRATNAERRIANLQNQLLQAEERVTAMNEKTSSADAKWEARVREYEARLRKAEEAVKRERQGAKERVFELEAQMKSLQRQLEIENRRNQKLNEITEANGLNRSPQR